MLSSAQQDAVEVEPLHLERSRNFLVTIDRAESICLQPLRGRFCEISIKRSKGFVALFEAKDAAQKRDDRNNEQKQTDLISPRISCL